MFIISKRNFLIQIPGRAPYRIPKDYIGEIPDDIAAHWMIQDAIRSGMISTPVGKKDNQLEAADEVAEEKAAAVDIRPDAQKPAVDVTGSRFREPESGCRSRKEKQKKRRKVGRWRHVADE